MILLRDRRRGLRCLWALLLTIGLIPVAQAELSLPLTLGCGWPFKTTPETLNVMYPDANAIYWTTPYIQLAGSSLEIRGDFFPARFLSINTYNSQGNSLSSIYDGKFVLDKGSENPFNTPSASGGSFHATIVPSPTPIPPSPPTSPDILYGPQTNQFGFAQGYVVIRAYIPFDPNVSQSVLPKITILFDGHPLKTVPPCKNLSNSLRLLLYNALIRSWNGNFNAPGATEPTQLMFRPPVGNQAGGAFPNDFNKYVVTGMTYQKGVIAVVRGRAATVPSNGSNNYPLLEPDQELRYWSMCNYDHIFPYPVVTQGSQTACAADDQTPLDHDGYYTYVIATPRDVPANAKTDPTVTLLPWGRTQFTKALIFRNMLPGTNFTMTTQTANTQCTKDGMSTEDSATCTANVMGPYYPTATYCQKTVYEEGGWQACFQTPVTVRRQ